MPASPQRRLQNPLKRRTSIYSSFFFFLIQQQPNPTQPDSFSFRSEDAEGKKADHASRPARGAPRGQHGSRPAAPRGGEKPAARPAEVKEKAQKEVEAEQPKEVAESASTESPNEEGEAKDADSTKGKSYAEILRMKAALKEQAKPAANGTASETSSGGAPTQPRGGEKAQASGGRPPAGGRHPPAQGGASSRQRPSNSASGSGSGAPRPRNAPDSHTRHRTRSQNSEDVGFHCLWTFSSYFQTPQQTCSLLNSLVSPASPGGEKGNPLLLPLSANLPPRRRLPQ